MIHHKQGSTITLKHKKSVIKYYLLKFLGEFRDNDRKAEFRLKVPTDEGHTKVSFEVWETLNLDTGARDITKIPVYIFEEIIDSLDTDRPGVIDDNQEVTSLLDSYECWFTGVRDKKNFHLKLINDKHSEQIFKLRELDSDLTLPVDYRAGIRLKLMQKENPTHEIRRDFNIWKKQFPEFFTKLVNYVYTNTITATNSDEGL